MAQQGFQASFGRGVLTDELLARIDLQQYGTALADSLNGIVGRQGNWKRRAGFQFAGMAKDAAGAENKGALVPYIRSDTQAYVLELAENVLRVFALGGQVYSGPSPYEVATPWSRAEARELDFAQWGDELYVVHGSHAPCIIRSTGDTGFTVSTMALEDGPYLDVALNAATLTPSARGKLSPSAVSASSQDAFHPPADAFDDDPTSYWEAFDPSNPEWIKADFGSAKRVTGYSLQADGKSEGLRAPRGWTVEGSNDNATWTALQTVTGETGWAEGERRYYTFVNPDSYRYYRLYITDVNDAEDAAKEVRIASLAFQGAGADAQSITITAGSAAGINNGQGFLATDVGRHLRWFSEDAYWHWFVITARASSTQVTAELRSPPLPSTKRTGTWRLGAFSDTTGWPQKVCFHQSRIWFGRTRGQPRQFWGSRVFVFTDHSTSVPLKDDDAMSLSIDGDAPITFLKSDMFLVIGSTTHVRSVGAADRTKGFSANNYIWGRPKQVGMANVRPIDTDGEILAAGKLGKALHVLSLSSDGVMPGYDAPDATVLSEKLLFAGIQQVVFAESPSRLGWQRLADGTMVSVTYEKSQQMAAFLPHAMAADNVGEAAVESLCVVPGVGRDEVWAMVYRPGVGRTVERQAPEFRNMSQASAFLVDCGLSYYGAPATVISGLGHLEGQTVDIFADGKRHAVQVVVGGSITLDYAASVVHIGLGYVSYGRTLRMAQVPTGAPGIGKRKIVKGLQFDLLETALLEARTVNDDHPDREWVPFVLRTQPETIGAAPPLFSGATDRTALDGTWSAEGQVEWRSVGPTPLTIRALMPVYDGEP